MTWRLFRMIRKAMYTKDLDRINAINARMCEKWRKRIYGWVVANLGIRKPLSSPFGIRQSPKKERKIRKKKEEKLDVLNIS